MYLYTNISLGQLVSHVQKQTYPYLTLYAKIYPRCCKNLNIKSLNYESSKSKKKGCLIFSEWNPWSHKQMIKQYDWLGKNSICLYSKLFKNKVKRQKTNRKTICNVFWGQKAHILKRNIFHYLTHRCLANISF